MTEALPETPEVLDSPDSLVCLETEASPDQREQLVVKDVLVLQDCLELLVRVQLGRPDPQDLLEILEALDLPVKLPCCLLTMQLYRYFRYFEYLLSCCNQLI